jgi:hypothetical protein
LFVTEPEFEQYMPTSVLGDQHWWRAVTMFGTSRWFLFQYLAADGEQSHETALVVDEWSLIAAVGDVPETRRRSICRFQRENAGGRWELKWVDSLWIPAPIELEATGVLLVRFEGAADLLDSRLQPVPPREGRRLLFRTNPVMPRTQVCSKN